MSEGLTPFDSDQDLDGVLPEPFAGRRVALLQEHTDAVLEVRSRHQRAWAEMLGHEVQLLTMVGFSPRLAEQAGKNNLALRKRELDEELTAELCRLQGELRRKVQRVIEDWQDGQE